MNLVIDIGNSSLKAGWFNSHGLVSSTRSDVAVDTLAEIAGSVEVRAVLVSSVGRIDKQTIGSIAGNPDILFLDTHLPLPVKIRYGTPETLGKDRIAATAGALALYPGLPVLVIDLGTAITIDFLSPAGEFTGGNISPGLHTRFRSLHAFTARLPLQEKDAGWPDFGSDTRSAIVAGVQRGILYELEGYIADFAHRYPDCRFILTGGDASFFANRLKKPIFADPDLVLKGLNHILNYNLACNR
jgi:type III pantothenate kinase